MITSETPEQQELRYFASLLRTSEKTTSVIKKPYESLFIQATKEHLKGNLESALKTYSRSVDLTPNNINISSF